MGLKIKLFKYKLKATIDDDIAKTVAYFKKHGIDITFEIQDTNVIKSDAVLKLMMPNDGKCDIVMYMYEKNLFSAPTFGLAFSVSKTLQGIYLASDIVQDGVDYTWKSMCHEIMHTLFYKFGAWALDPMDSMLVGGVMKPYYKNEDLDAPDGNFAEAWRRLSNYINKPMYTYFSQKELDQWKLRPELWKVLDNARKLSGTPFIITSGLRSISENTRVGGKSNSSHLKGLAVDILCTDNIKRSRILYGLLDCGVPLFIEVARKHIHIDIDSSIHDMAQVMIERNDD